MFNTITQETREAKAIVGAAVATVKVLHEERKEIATAIAEHYPMLPKKEQKAYVNELFAYRVNHGLINN